MTDDRRDHQQLSDAYYKEAREQYIGDGNNTLTVTTWLTGFLLIWVQLTIATITPQQKLMVVGTVGALFVSIFLSFWARRKVNEFLNDTGEYFEQLAAGQQPADAPTEIDPWQFTASQWALGLGFAMALGLVLSVLYS